MLSRIMKEMVVLGMAAFALVYLMFPSFGVFELVPDILPVVGWIDEGVATLILVNTLRYYGLDLSRLYGAGRDENAEPGQKRQRRSPGAKEDPDVIPHNPEGYQSYQERR